MNSANVAATEVRSPQDIVQLVEQKNYDIKLIQENTRRLEAFLNQLKGGYYYPSVTSRASYLDDRREPLSPFLPARVREGFWNAVLESKTPLGLTLSAGKKFLGTRFGQADPPNPLLPYPATYFQPEIFLEASLDLTRDLLGYLAKKEIAIAETDITVSRYQERLLRHRLALTALELYYQLPLLEKIQADSDRVIRDFGRLEQSLAGKVEKSLAESSDLFNIRSLIAQQRSVLGGADRSINDLKRSIAVLLGDADLRIISMPSDAQLGKTVRSCEATVLQSEFDPAFSEAQLLRGEEVQKAELQAKIYRRQLLPSLRLTGSAVSSGTDSTYGSSLKELSQWDRPAYRVGLDLAWQGSPGIFRAARQNAEAVKNTALLEQARQLLEQKTVWKNLQSNIVVLRKRQKELNQSVGFSEQEVADLENQYLKGRLSLFELTQQRIRLLQVNIEATRTKQERLSNLLQSLQEFDRFDCQLIPAS